AVAVQFLEHASDLRARLHEHLEGASEETTEPAVSSEPQDELEVEAEYTEPGYVGNGSTEPEYGLREGDSFGEPVEFDELDDLAVDPGELEHVLKDVEGELLDEDLATPAQDERRSGPRGRASVPVQLATTDFQLDGRTRDLSESGVLISADATELPLGKKVKVRLQSPNSGDPIEVSGRVSRRVETDGTVAAVGVEFEASDGESDVIAEYVQEVQADAAERRETGISGPIEELGMPNLIQVLGSTSAKGTLIATRGEEEGVIAFESGLLRYARLGSLRSIKALSRLLAWEQGRFEFSSNVDALEEEDEPQSLEVAILEAVRQMDECGRVGGVTVEMTTTFQVDGDARSQGAEGSKIEQAVLDLAEAGFTLRRLIDVIPEPDAEILGAVNALVDLGVLTPN
ncbi:MAG: DUF4388 domain-containing protein, partial [bacterium]|nr:DUF4388 domain-containing protein [bacterium]